MDLEPRILRFDAFEIDCDNRQLRRNGMPIELGSRYFDALALLVERRGELVTKQAFMDQVWHGIPVTDEALTQCIRNVRRALGDDAANPRFIATVPKHGYRFIATDHPRARLTPATKVSRMAGACALAGLGAGGVAGLVYGLIAVTGGGAQVLILSAIVAALGLLAGSGLGAGIATAIAWRGSADGWVIVGAGVGGLSVGALGNMLARESVALLSGKSLTNVTGPSEGLILGCAAGFAALAVLRGFARRSIVATCVIAGFGAAFLMFLSEGTLLAGSLHAVEQGLPATRISVARIGMIIGEAGFTGAVNALTMMVETQVFVLAIGLGLMIAHHEATGRD